MDTYYPETEPTQHWIIGVLVSVAVVIVVFLCAMYYHRQMVRNRIPALEAGSNGDCKNVATSAVVMTCQL